MATFVKLTTLDDLPPGAACEIEYEGQVIALFHHDGQIFAMDGLCPHQGGPLAEGEVSGCLVTCPWHGWQFDLRTGQAQHAQRLFQPVFEVRVEGQDVLVGIP